MGLKNSYPSVNLVLLLIGFMEVPSCFGPYPQPCVILYMSLDKKRHPEEWHVVICPHIPLNKIF